MGPQRPTYIASEPADYVTFNSITDNPVLGDERNFVRIREINDRYYTDELNLVSGKEYEVYIYYHNNAKDSLNSKENFFRGIALDAKIKVVLPSKVNSEKRYRVYAEISASNAKPEKVWDEAWINSVDGEIYIYYVKDSAHVISKGSINKERLSGKQLLHEGVLLGYDVLNGVLPGCDQYSGVILFRFFTSSVKLSGL